MCLGPLWIQPLTFVAVVKSKKLQKQHIRRRWYLYFETKLSFIIRQKFS